MADTVPTQGYGRPVPRAGWVTTTYGRSLGKFVKCMLSRGIRAAGSCDYTASVCSKGLRCAGRLPSTLSPICVQNLKGFGRGEAMVSLMTRLAGASMGAGGTINGSGNYFPASQKFMIVVFAIALGSSLSGSVR